MIHQESWSWKGAHGHVYLLPNGLAAKVPHEGQERRIVNESCINQKLHDDGFPVPRPYGMQNIQIDGLGVKRAFIREFVEGTPIFHLNDDDYRFYLREMDDLLKTIYDKGYVYQDSNSKNAILTPDDRIVLIDFAKWKYNGRLELETEAQL